jgi:hypothetical protein
MTVTNGGKATATDVVVSDALPTGTVFASEATSQGTIAAPPVGSNGTVTVNLGSLANGANATVSIITTVTATTVAGTVLTDTATVSATTQDLNSKKITPRLEPLGSLRNSLQTLRRTRVGNLFIQELGDHTFHSLISTTMIIEEDRQMIKLIFSLGFAVALFWSTGWEW